MTDRDEPDLTAPRRALVLIDVQNEYARLPLRIRYPRLRDCMERIERVLDAAESAGLPVVCVQHAGPPGGAIFAPGGKGFELCPSIERRRTPQWKSVVKHHGSIYAGTDLAAWLHEQGVDTVLVDTAGRLQNKSGLMDQLGKIKRVIEKEAPVTEVLLVIDATTGQNGMVQAKVFGDIVDVTGIVLTKLDGTAKGGIVVAIQEELDVPVKLIGLGEGPDDLAPFDPEAFVDALLD